MMALYTLPRAETGLQASGHTAELMTLTQGNRSGCKDSVNFLSRCQSQTRVVSPHLIIASNDGNYGLTMASNRR